MTAARNHFLGLELPRTLQSLAVISSHWQTLANIDLVSRLHVTFKDELINIREQPLHFVDFHGIPNDPRRSIAFCTAPILASFSSAAAALVLNIAASSVL